MASAMGAAGGCTTLCCAFLHFSMLLPVMSYLGIPGPPEVCAGGEMDSDLIVAAEVWIVHSFGLLQEVPKIMVQRCNILWWTEKIAILLHNFWSAVLHYQAAFKSVSSAYEVLGDEGVRGTVSDAVPEPKLTLMASPVPGKRSSYNHTTRTNKCQEHAAIYDHFSHSRYWHQITLAGSCWQVRCWTKIL